ncbi:MAG: PTS galactosamine/N-acetylgalactosamine transporter subunit IIA [Tuberibacillus sp.]
MTNGIIVTGHGHFATGQQAALKLIAGVQENIQFIDFEESDTTETLSKKFEAALNSFEDCNGVLFLCDLVGGTPFKTAVLMAAKEDRYEVVGGANLPMILEMAFTKNTLSIRQLKEKAIQSGRDNIQGFQSKSRPKIESNGI